MTESCVGCLAAPAAKDTDAVDALEPPNLFGRLQTVHDGQLNVHEHQMETSCFPFCHGLLSVHRSLPSDLETLHESSENSQVNDVVLHDQDVDRWHGAIEQTSR